MEYRNGHSEVRRSRRLVLSFVATVVNYEYCFYWMFYQAGLLPSPPEPCGPPSASGQHLCSQEDHALLRARAARNPKRFSMSQQSLMAASQLSARSLLEAGTPSWMLFRLHAGMCRSFTCAANH